MVRKGKKLVETKKASITRARPSSSTSALKKIKDYERCKEWLLEQQNINHQPVETQDIDDDDNSDMENELYQRRIEQEEKSEPSVRGAARLNINILCEWKRCRVECKNLDEFRAHVDQHIDNITPQETYDCHWDLCSYKTNIKSEITTHIGFHVYHTNLKNVGECYLKSKSNLPNCTLDSRCRNLIPDDATSYECKWEDCDKTFLKICDFMDHVREHGKFEAKLRRKSENNIMKCRWIGCDKTYKLVATFTDHRRTHTKEKQCGCPNCGTSFRNFSKFYDHYRRQAVTNEFQCSQCLKYFFSMELLRNHQHSHVNRYKCTMCDMTTSSPSGLVQHVRYRHLKSRPFNCLQCDYSAVYKHDLDKHIATVHKTVDTVYECQECDYSTDKLFMLRKHNLNIHQGEIYCCHLCPKKYGSGNLLSKHLIKKHEFQLPFGHSRFNYRQDLDGFFRVQTTRTESLEVTQQIMLPAQRDAAKTTDVTYKVSELYESEKGLSIQVTGTTRLIDTTTAPVFYDSSNDENLFFTLPDLNFDSNSEEDRKSYYNENDQDLDDQKDDIAKSTCLSPIKTPESKNVPDSDEDSLDIKNFSVMRRYLKKEKKSNIIIELNDVDESGVIVKTQTVKANEFSYND